MLRLWISLVGGILIWNYNIIRNFKLSSIDNSNTFKNDFVVEYELTEWG